jgi:hypothetical protein
VYSTARAQVPASFPSASPISFTCASGQWADSRARGAREWRGTLPCREDQGTGSAQEQEREASRTFKLPNLILPSATQRRPSSSQRGRDAVYMGTIVGLHLGRQKGSFTGWSLRLRSAEPWSASDLAPFALSRGHARNNGPELAPGG